MRHPRNEALSTVLVGALAALACGGLLALDPQAFWQDDNQLAVSPTFHDIGRALLAGEWPALTPWNWMAGNFLGDHQFGLFSAFLLPLAAFAVAFLPGPNAEMSLLCGVHAVILAMGAFRVARYHGLDGPGAGLVAAVATFNGWNMAWGAASWFSHFSSFAWLPWLWWAQERALDEPGRWRFAAAAGVFLYLLIASGWPLTDLMAAIATAAIVARRWLAGQRRPAAYWPVAAAWLLGVGLGLPALMTFREHLKTTLRGMSGRLPPDWTWSVPAGALPGLLAPNAAATWIGSWGKAVVRTPLELAGATVPAAALVAALVLQRGRFARPHAWLLALTVGMFLLAIAPSWSIARWSFRWLPLLHLALALAGARALAALRDDGAWAPPAALLAAIAAAALVPHAPSAAAADAVPLAAFSAAIAATWLAAARGPAPLRAWAPLVAAVALLATTYAVPRPPRFPAWAFDAGLMAPAPLEPGRRYLSLGTDAEYFEHRIGDAAFGTLFRPGNTGVFAEIEVVNGYCPLQPFGLECYLLTGLHGFFPPDGVRRVLRDEHGPDGMLDLLGIEGLVVPRAFAPEASQLPARGWRRAAERPEGLVFHRAPRPRVYALPSARVWPELEGQNVRLRGTIRGPWLVRPGAPAGPVRFGDARLGPLASGRTRAAVDVLAADPARESLIVFSRAWFAGWRAYANGRELPVEALNRVMPAVRWPAGETGRLELVFWPRSLTLGLWLGALMVLLAAVVAFLGARRAAQ